jgi:hypothetical protein
MSESPQSPPRVKRVSAVTRRRGTSSRGAALLWLLCRGRALFGVRHQSGEARVAMERLEIGILFDVEIGSGAQPVVNSLSQKRQRPITVAFVGQNLTEVGCGDCRERMLRPQDTTLNIQGLANQLLCLGVAALVFEKDSQVTHHSQCVRMLRPQDTTLHIQGLARQLLSQPIRLSLRVSSNPLRRLKYDGCQPYRRAAMKLFRALLGTVLWTALAAGQEVNCDLSDYKAQDGLKAEMRAGVLELTWRGERQNELHAAFAVRKEQPLVRELAVRKSGGKWVVLGQNLTPEFQLTSGIRRLSSQQVAPLKELG